MTKYKADQESKEIISLYRELKKDLPKFIPVSLCVIGEGMVGTNAEKLNAEIECTLNGKRYLVKAKFKIIQQLKND